MITKLFIKNFYEKLTCEDIINAIRSIDVGSVYSVQIRTSRRNIHHAIVEIIWDDTKSTSQFLRGLLNEGNTVCISLNSNYPDSYIEMVEYHEEVDTKRQKRPPHSDDDELLVGYPKSFRRNIHGPPPPSSSQIATIDEYEKQGGSKAEALLSYSGNLLKGYDAKEYGEEFSRYGENILRNIGIY